MAPDIAVVGSAVRGHTVWQSSARGLSGCEVAVVAQPVLDEEVEEPQQVGASFVGAQRHLDVGAPTTPQIRSFVKTYLAGMHYFSTW